MPRRRPATSPRARCPTATSWPSPRAAASMAELEVDEQELSAYDYLLTPAAIRDRAGAILEAGRHGTLAHFRVSEEPLRALAERVIAVSRESYPDLRAIPYHGRYRHFDVGGVPRLAQFLNSLEGASNEEKLR